ncbi:Trihelix transcription factor [Quillaja saponaria]|uniref:Trihelix transcription factor n=1 Tax=Quillaja saponaria TaxID=32244 RepID=A0AAD7LQA9_QUISA|nr:Trihelix transcription factor [Quillaja saponaria]
MDSPPSPKLFSTALATTTTTASSTKKPQPIPWSHQETVNLIQSYQEKWYSLKRGQLRANQWEEVAVTVAARCGYDYNEPSKSAIQCRHKMEKLRQRYRAENHRLSTSVSACGWQYFDLMDQLERGPLPISARPLMQLVPPSIYEDEEEDDDNEDEEDYRENNSKSRSINHILKQRPTIMDRFVGNSAGVSRFFQDRVPKRLWIADDVEEEDEEEEEEEEAEERGLFSEVAAEIKGFAQRYIGLQNLKMEMMKETERCRLEMENKRMEMILESQHRIVDSIGRAFRSPKKMKISQEI